MVVGRIQSYLLNDTFFGMLPQIAHWLIGFSSTSHELYGTWPYFAGL